MPMARSEAKKAATLDQRATSCRGGGGGSEGGFWKVVMIEGRRKSACAHLRSCSGTSVTVPNDEVDGEVRWHVLMLGPVALASVRVTDRRVVLMIGQIGEARVGVRKLRIQHRVASRSVSDVTDYITGTPLSEGLFSCRVPVVERGCCKARAPAVC